MAYFRTCRYCGANLDPGERCSCSSDEGGHCMVPDGYELRKGREIVKLLAPPKDKPLDEYRGGRCSLVEVYKFNFQE